MSANPVEVIFLGTGSAIPVSGNSNSSYLVRLASETLLIDCGPTILQQLDAVGFSPKQISHVFFTHRHGDHALGYPMLMLWYQLNAGPDIRPPVLIASERTLIALDDYMQVAYGDIGDIPKAAPRIVLPTDQPAQVRIHPHVMLRTWPMNHSDFAPVLGLRIDTRAPYFSGCSLAFTGDTGPCENIAPLAQNADLLVHEADLCATIHPHFVNGAFGHSTAQMAGRNAKTANAKHLALTHMDFVYHGQEQVLMDEAKREFDGRVSMPMPGVVYTL